MEAIGQISPDGTWRWSGSAWVPNMGDPEAILQAEVARYVKKGYRVVSQAARTAQLVKPKKFSFWWAFFWMLWALIGFFVYLAWYMGKKDEQVYLSVADTGKITRTG